MEIEEIVQRILSHHPNLTSKKVIMAIQKKKAATGGLLTDEAAARLVAAEWGVEAVTKQPFPKIHIRQLVSGLNNVTLFGRVLLVREPRKFPSNHGFGQMAWLLLGDETGTVRVAMWNDKAKLASKTHVGQIVKVVHGYVRQSRYGTPELHVGERGTIQINASDVEEGDLPLLRDFIGKIADITPSSKRVHVEGAIRIAYPMSSFQRRDGTQGKIVRVILEDETGKIPVAFWNEKAEDIAKANVDMKIFLINAKVKRNPRNELLELHVEDSSHVGNLGNNEKSSPEVVKS